MKRAGGLVLLVCLCLVGCARGWEQADLGGQVLSREEQITLYEQRLEEQSEPNVTAKGTVYWSKSGSKYHKDPKCSHLQNAKELYSGTVAQAANYGADSPCSRCAGG